MSFIVNLLDRVISKEDKPKESVADRLFREYVRDIHNPKIMTPAEYRRALQPLEEDNY